MQESQFLILTHPREPEQIKDIKDNPRFQILQEHTFEVPLTKDVYIGFKIATDMSFEEVDAFLERTARDPVHTWNFQHFSISQTAVFPGDADFQTVVAQEEKKLDAAEDEMANMVKQAKEWKKLDLAKRLEEGLLHMVSIRYRESGNISRATLHHMGVLGFGPDWRKCEAH